MALPSQHPRPSGARARPGAPDLPEDWEGAAAVALGRHALALVAQDLRARGITRIAVPDYHCVTMTLPFQLEGLHIAHVAVGEDLMADPAALERAILGDGQTGRGRPACRDRSGGAAPASWAILHCELFGAPPSPELSRALGGLREAGAILVLDDTHRWPLPALVDADYLAVSARKLTGLSDGALARGGAIGEPGGPRPLPRGGIDRAATAAWLAGDRDRAEDLMDLQLSPAAMSSQARAALSGLDLSALTAARRSEAARLHDALEDRGIAPLSPRDGHFCVAFRDPAGPVHAQRLVRDLALAGVDGPVWWPRPAGWSREWPEDVVTLPLADDEGGAGRRTGTAARVLSVLDSLLR
jgi:hypothetical protein